MQLRLHWICPGGIAFLGTSSPPPPPQKAIGILWHTLSLLKRDLHPPPCNPIALGRWLCLTGSQGFHGHVHLAYLNWILPPPPPSPPDTTLDQASGMAASLCPRLSLVLTLHPCTAPPGLRRPCSDGPLDMAVLPCSGKPTASVQRSCPVHTSMMHTPYGAAAVT